MSHRPLRVEIIWPQGSRQYNEEAILNLTLCDTTARYGPFFFSSSAFRHQHASQYQHRKSILTDYTVPIENAPASDDVGSCDGDSDGDPSSQRGYHIHIRFNWDCLQEWIDELDLGEVLFRFTFNYRPRVDDMASSNA